MTNKKRPEHGPESESVSGGKCPKALPTNQSNEILMPLFRLTQIPAALCAKEPFDGTCTAEFLARRYSPKTACLRLNKKKRFARLLQAALLNDEIKDNLACFDTFKAHCIRKLHNQRLTEKFGDFSHEI